MDEVSCVQLATPIARNLGFKLALSMHTTLCLIAIVQSLFTIQRLHKLYFHANTKIIIVVLLLTYIVNNAFLSFAYTHTIVRLSLPLSCSSLVAPVDCLLMRAPSNVAAFVFPGLHFSLSLERIAARKFRATYDAQRPFIGAGLATASVLLGCALYAYIIHEEHWDPSLATPFCTVGNKYTAQHASDCMLFLFGVDLLGLLFMSASYRMERREKSFNSMERRECSSVLLPFTVMHTVSYLVYEVVYALVSRVLVGYLPDETFRVLFVLIYFVPYYTVISNVMLMRLLSALQRSKDARWQAARSISADSSLARSAYSAGW